MPRKYLRSVSGNTTPARPVVSHTTISQHSAKRPRATPTKSQYFAHDKTKYIEPKEESDDDSVSAAPSTVDHEGSGYEDEDVTASEPTSEEEDAYSESDAPPAKRRKHTPKSTPKPVAGVTSAPTSTKSTKGQELWRPGIKTGLAPGTQVIIDKPKARPAGKVPYKDNTIHPNTMLFLSDLVENNDREWFKMHDPDYRTSWSDFTSFLEGLQERLIALDETIPELPTKDIVFRVYRDIRFSKDPTPYKAHFAAAWSRTGRKGPYAAYYVQIKPGGSFVGGGLWCPEAQPVAKLRRDIDRKPHKIKAVLMDEGLRNEFFDGLPANEAKAVKAFTAGNAGNALKSKPKGFDADHKNISLLRLKNFTVGRKLKDEEVVGEKGMDRIAYLLSKLVPFVSSPFSTCSPGVS